MRGIIIRYRVMDPVWGEVFALRIFSVQDSQAFLARSGPEYEQAVAAIKKTETGRGRTYLGDAVMID